MSYPLRYENDRWACPITGVVVAKDRAGNLAQRAAIIDRLDADAGFAERFKLLCTRSVKLWLNLAAWTYVLVDQSAGGRVAAQAGRHEPFITWPCQDGFLDAWDAAKASGGTLLGPKSREMGATWLVLADFVHACQFLGNQERRVMSRGEEAVERSGDTDALMWKIDYLCNYQPKSMVPRVDRVHMLRRFSDTGSTITGSATTSKASAGGRGGAMLIDEAALIDDLASVVSTTQDTVGARVLISTPRAGSHFSAMRRSAKYKTHGLWWWDHPEKGLGRSQVADASGKMGWTSPWYVAEAAKRDARNIAENLNGEDGDESRVVFSPSMLEAHRSMHAVPPVAIGTIALPTGTLIDPHADADLWPVDKAEFRACAGPWELWCSLTKSKREGLRPVHSGSLALGVDVARGTGASNSVISVVDAMDGRKIASFVSPNVSPSELADVLYIAAHWFVGKDGQQPIICVEAPGAGQETLIRLSRLGYANLYRHTKADAVKQKRSTSLGWPSGRTLKGTQLRLYAHALSQNRFINPCEKALAECQTYVWLDGGGCGPLSGVTATPGELAAHGDRVIADMLAQLAAENVGRWAPVRNAPPHGTLARQLYDERGGDDADILE